MAEESRDTQASIPDGTRCVVLVGKGGSAPGDLLGGLSRRGVATVVVAEPAEVMLELARQSTGALIVVEPDGQPWLDDLVQAVRLYHPRTVRWCYRPEHPSGQAQLQPLADHAQDDENRPTYDHIDTLDTQDGPTHFTLPNPRSPLGRVQSQVPRERMRSLVVKVQGPTEVGEPLISEEELAMLLGPVPEEQAEPGEPGGRP